MRVFYNLLGLFFVFTLLIGCTTSRGGFHEKSHFSFPNSNVIPLGAVKVVESKFSILFPPAFEREDQLSLLNKALEQKAGADLLINYKLDVDVTIVPIPIFTLIWLDVILEGTAASMEIGDQELNSVIEAVRYK